MLDQMNSTFTVLVSTLSPPILSQDKIHLPSLDTHAEVLTWLIASLTWSNLLKTILLSLIAANFKNFPLIYHLRILNGVRFLLRSQRPPDALTPAQIFQPLITSSKASLLETDVFGHKSNSTYFSDVDVARVHLLTTLFSHAIEKVRGSTTMNGLSGKSRSAFTIPLGGVSCTFRRELKPYQAYDMWTRILSWDDKWFYIVTHFVKKGAKIEPREYTLYPRQKSLSSSAASSLSSSVSSSRQGSVSHGLYSTDDGSSAVHGRTEGGSDVEVRSPVCASAMSKIVFKNGRKTISPETMLEAAGLLPPRSSSPGMDYEPSVSDHNVAPTAEIEYSPMMKATKVEGPTTVASLTLPDSFVAPSTRRSSIQTSDPAEITRADIEIERQRGMQLARLLGGQTALDNELHDEIALGRHYDGYGLEGVVATLAQLGGFSRWQLL